MYTHFSPLWGRDWVCKLYDDSQYKKGRTFACQNCILYECLTGLRS